MPTILYEGQDLTLPSGAGKATYAKNLGAAARRLGYATKVLVGIDKALQRREPLLTEIALYDARAERWPSWPVNTELAGAAIIGKPFGIATVELIGGGSIVDAPQSNLREFDATLVATRLMDVARLHFRRYGRRASLRLPAPPAIFHATTPAPLLARHCANLYTIHDLVPLRLPYATLDDKRYFLRLVRHLGKTADHIVTVSEFSRQELIRFAGIPEHRITNTYQAVSIPAELTSKNEDELADELSHAFKLDFRGYFLFFGAVEPKKNIARLIDSFAASGVDRPLIIAGPLGWQHEIDVEKIQDERFLNYRVQDGNIFADRRVRRLSYVPFPQLVSLIRGARAVLFPSLYEGFGLPVLEAMLLGTPVLTSNVSSLPEVTGDAAVLVDPTDLDKLGSAIRIIDQDADLRAELSAKGRARAEMFSSEAYQARLAKLYGRFAELPKSLPCSVSPGSNVNPDGRRPASP